MKRSHFYLLLIIALALFLRCQGLFNPILDKHSWRQTDTASVAYNYYASGMNLFQPRLDVLPEVRELEFHLYPYTVALFYTAFGFNEVWGRVVSILCGVGTLWFIFLLTRKYFSEPAALFAALFWSSSPTAVFYNRAFLPESMLLLCLAGGLYCFLRWVWTDQPGFMAAAAGFLTCALLIKITSVYLAGPIAYVLWQKYNKKVIKTIPVYLFGLLVLTPPAIYYIHQHFLFKAVSWGTSIWEIGSDKWFNRSILLNPDFYQKVWLQYLGEQHFAYTGYVFLFIGWIFGLPRKARVFSVWMWAIFAYFIIVAVGNYVHDYYQLGVLIPGAVLVGRGIDYCLEKAKEWRNPAALILTITAVAWLPVCGYTRSIGDEKFDIRYKMAGESLAAVSQKKDRALIVSDGEPEVLYYAHRKGWHLDRAKYSLGWLRWYIPQGVKFVVVLGPERKEFTAVPQNYSQVGKSLTPKEQTVIEELENHFTAVRKTDWFWIFRTDRVQ